LAAPIHRRRFLFAGMALAYGPHAGAAEVPVVAGASDLQGALPEVAAAFQKKARKTVRLTFGSSGQFTHQILQGAPFELFLSADEAYVRRLQAAGRTEGGGALYAIGRIGLFVPKSSRVRPFGDLRDIGPALREGRLKRLSIADPAHAPYGVAAKEALTKAGLWTVVQRHLVLGANASQATTFTATGAAEAGIIPYSLALRPEVRTAGTFALISDEWHNPLRQRAALIRGAGPTAREFFTFVQGAEARTIFKRYGFVLPGEKVS
jgi:molybdate transport system substrate-binding protein